MKKLIVLVVMLVASMGVAMSQNYMVVDSEKIFKSISAYNSAITELDELSKAYQAQVDAKFSEIEQLYNNYQQQKANLSAAVRQARENTIIQKENEATKYQQEMFGADGVVMKRRIELMSPIQKRVFDTIENYCKGSNYDMVIDIASNATLLYYKPSIDKTEAIIKLVK